MNANLGLKMADMKNWICCPWESRGIVCNKRCITLYCLQMSGMLRIVKATASCSGFGCNMLKAFSASAAATGFFGSIPDGKSSDCEADDDDEEQFSFGDTGQNLPSKCSWHFSPVDVVLESTRSYSGGHAGSLWIRRCSVSLKRCNRSSQLCWNSCRSLIKLISGQVNMLTLNGLLCLGGNLYVWLTKSNHIFFQCVVAFINAIYDSSP